MTPIQDLVWKTFYAAVTAVFIYDVHNQIPTDVDKYVPWNNQNTAAAQTTTQQASTPEPTLASATSLSVLALPTPSMSSALSTNGNSVAHLELNKTGMSLPRPLQLLALEPMMCPVAADESNGIKELSADIYSLPMLDTRALELSSLDLVISDASDNLDLETMDPSSMSTSSHSESREEDTEDAQSVQSPQFLRRGYEL